MNSRRIALIQFDAVPEEKDRNLREMERLTRAAAKQGARWIVFHESTVTDYTPKLSELAEPVPSGPSTRAIQALGAELGVFISFGLSEVEGDRYYIAQVFVGPDGLVTSYRKTWICRKENDEGYRNEWERYDPGNGPEAFTFDGVECTCFVCSDGAAPRCIQRAADLKPQVVFYPHNVRFGVGPKGPVKAAQAIGAPVLYTNRVGRSWTHDSPGGTGVISATGEVLAIANNDGREEILSHDLEIQASRRS